MIMLTVVDCKIVRKEYEKAKAVATMSTGEVDVIVLEWYDDEIDFRPAEFIGKTEDQIGQMFLARDTAYLRS